MKFVVWECSECGLMFFVPEKSNKDPDSCPFCLSNNSITIRTKDIPEVDEDDESDEEYDDFIEE